MVLIIIENVNQRIPNFIKSSSSQKEKIYQEWLERKRKQIEQEREYKKKLELLLADSKNRSTPEERSKAFREWINRKIRERKEELRSEKIEHKKWLARRRKSRKHQRLSQALEMAHAYGYSNAYYLPGFNF